MGTSIDCSKLEAPTECSFGDAWATKAYLDKFASDSKNFSLNEREQHISLITFSLQNLSTRNLVSSLATLKAFFCNLPISMDPALPAVLLKVYHLYNRHLLHNNIQVLFLITWTSPLHHLIAVS